MYIIYGKEHRGRKFLPVSFDEQGFVYKIMYATIFEDEGMALRACEMLNQDNENMIFEVRKR